MHTTLTQHSQSILQSDYNDSLGHEIITDYFITKLTCGSGTETAAMNENKNGVAGLFDALKTIKVKVSLSNKTDLLARRENIQVKTVFFVRKRRNWIVWRTPEREFGGVQRLGPVFNWFWFLNKKN